MSTITGLEFYRCKRRMQKVDLHKAAGVSLSSITVLEALPTLDKCRMELILRLADALEVTVDQILEIHDRKELTPLDRSFQVSTDYCARNPVAIYRQAKNLTLRELGKLLGGLTKWGTSKVCRTAKPPCWHIRTLASLEGMTEEEFLETFRYDDEVEEDDGEDL